MSDLKRKLSAVFNTTWPKYKRLKNYDPDNVYPDKRETYKKYPQPEPKKGGRRRKRKLNGGRRPKHKGGRRRKHKGGRRRKKR
jgi:hypothetical protein